MVGRQEGRCCTHVRTCICGVGTLIELDQQKSVMRPTGKGVDLHPPTLILQSLPFEGSSGPPDGVSFEDWPSVLQHAPPSVRGQGMGFAL